MLIEDGPTSDTRGWPRNSGGAPLVTLCRYHSLEYKNSRLGLKCTEPGCWHLGEPGPGGKRICVKHGRRKSTALGNEGGRAHDENKPPTELPTAAQAPPPPAPTAPPGGTRNPGDAREAKRGRRAPGPDTSPRQVGVLPAPSRTLGR